MSMPSYIMATIESLGDKELIAALEEEMFLMTADSEAELQLHDTIEELFDHVRDGEITPEQAAQVLTDELANPTGADIDTLVERAKLDGMKYMVDSKNKNNYNVNKNGGIEYDSQDTERVAGGRVSASDRSNNVLRKQGDDSGETSVRLGDGGVGSKSEKIKRHGSSGWLGEQQWTTDGSLRGLFGNLRGIKLASIDSLSRTIPNEVYERFKNTVLKNHDGTILSLYHFTDVVFSDFSIGDIGFHFGTINAAKKRKDDPRRRRRGEASIYKEVYLNIKQPAITTRDPANWTVFATSYVLQQEGYLSFEECASLEKYEGYHNASYNSDHGYNAPLYVRYYVS